MSSEQSEQVGAEEEIILAQIQKVLDERVSSEEERKVIIRQFLSLMSEKPSLVSPEERRRVLEQPLPQPLSIPDLKGDEEPKEVIERMQGIEGLKRIAEYIQKNKPKNIIVMCGAGISVSAGIPDFRTPGTGLYYNLQKYNLPDPQLLFNINYFSNVNPRPFYQVAKTIYPDNYHPTMTHCFIRLLDEKGLLLRDFTQNIDTLEHIAGIPEEKTVFCHGSFSKAHCIACQKEFPYEYVPDWLNKCSDDDEEGIIVKCDECGGCVKPDVTFFGEPLPRDFFLKRSLDFPQCDLLIVMGTSLVVQPFAGLIADVADDVPRLLINREVVGDKPVPQPDASEEERYRLRVSHRFNFHDPNNRRDALYQGSCDEACEQLANLLGWGKELKDIYNSFPDKKKKARAETEDTETADPETAKK